MALIFFISLLVDTALTISIYGVYFWRLDRLRQELGGGKQELEKFNGLISLYSFLLTASTTRIIFGFLLTRSYERLKAYGYTIPSAFGILFGIILCAAFNDSVSSYRFYKAELPIGVVTLLFNLIFLLVGSRVLQRGNVDNIL